MQHAIEQSNASLQTLSLLLPNLNQIAKVTERINASPGATFQAAQKAMETFNSATGSLSESWIQLRATIGTPMLDALTPLVGSLTALIEELNSFLEAHPKLTQYIADFIELSAVVLIVVGTLGVLSAVIMALSTGFAVLFSPILLGIVWVAALAYGIYRLYEYVGGLTGAWNSIKAAWGDVWGWLSAQFHSFTDDLATLWQGATDAFTAVLAPFSAAWSATWSAATEAFTATVNALSAPWSAAWSAMREAFTVTVAAFSAVLEPFEAAWRAMWSDAGEVFAVTVTALHAAWSDTWQSVRELFTAFWSWLSGEFQGSDVLDAFNGLVAALTTGWNGFVAVLNGIGNVVDGIVHDFQAAAAAVESILPGAGAGAASSPLASDHTPTIAHGRFAHQLNVTVNAPLTVTQNITGGGTDTANAAKTGVAQMLQDHAQKLSDALADQARNANRQVIPAGGY